MKITITLLLIIFVNQAYTQQNAIGSWKGKLEVANITIVFNFKNDNNVLSATMDSPDQSTFGINTDTLIIRNDSVFTNLKKFQISFSGQLINDTTISGVFIQGGSKLNLKLTRSSQNNNNKKALKPQTPIPPFPYNSEDVNFFNKDKSIKIAGTVTYPKEKSKNGFPAILLISGSGPQNRDEQIFDHKPFAVIADYLTKKGFLVLRTDDRGTVETTGIFASATSKDFAEDALASVEYLKSRDDVDKSNIGLLGHSEGGMIAPMVSNESKDIKFMILMAAPGIPISELMVEQNIAILESSGISKNNAEEYGKLYKQILNIVSKSPTNEGEKVKELVDEWSAKQSIEFLKLINLNTEYEKIKFSNSLAEIFTDKWTKYFISYDPVPALIKTKSKVLALNGSKDIQVIANSNLEGIKKAMLKGNKEYTIIKLKGLNHLFQKCDLCTANEYGELEETISQDALNAIGSWLEKENIISNK